MNIKTKLRKVQEIIQPMEKVLIAFSGGVDSVLLAKMCYDVLRNNSLAVTSFSPSTPSKDKQDSVAVAKLIGIPHLIIETDETQIENYKKNPTNRCYHCKTHLYERLSVIAKQKQIKYIVNGTNKDDEGDYRPGIQAAEEWSVRSPFLEAGLTKKDIREISQFYGLPTWEKPASPCLASRIPYGQIVTGEKMNAIDKAEQYLRHLGISGNIRVRHNHDTGRIEVEKQFFSKVKNNFKEIEDHFHQLGFTHIDIDKKGFRSGSLNEEILIR